MCRWTDAHTSRLNDMWLNGLIWQSQSEDYIRSLERVGERGRALHRSGYPTQLRRGDDWVNVKTRLHAIAMMGSPWSKKRSVQRTEYKDAKVLQSVTFLAQASKLADAFGKANKEHSKRSKRKATKTPADCDDPAHGTALHGAACHPFEDIITHARVLLLDFLRYALVTLPLGAHFGQQRKDTDGRVLSDGDGVDLSPGTPNQDKNQWCQGVQAQAPYTFPNELPEGVTSKLSLQDCAACTSSILHSRASCMRKKCEDYRYFSGRKMTSFPGMLCEFAWKSAQSQYSRTVGMPKGLYKQPGLRRAPCPVEHGSRAAALLCHGRKVNSGAGKTQKLEEDSHHLDQTYSTKGSPSQAHRKRRIARKRYFARRYSTTACGTRFKDEILILHTRAPVCSKQPGFLCHSPWLICTLRWCAKLVSS